MTILNYTVILKKTVLASFIGLTLGQSCFALEALSDENLSDTTGEGIAILPQNTYMVFRGTEKGNESTNAIFADRTNDIGYIHFTPVGPLSSTALNRPDGHSVGKADLFIYGLALSKSDNNTQTRIANNAADAQITSWGTAENPWVFKVGTATNVPNFNPGSTCGGASDANCKVPFLALEAPLYEDIYKRDPNTGQLLTPGTPNAAGADAYKLKLAAWADAFVLDQSKSPTDSKLYQLGETAGTSDAARANRLRLQMIWNNFSINGSRLQLFQTLGGVILDANGNPNSPGMSTFYNNSLGLSGLLRINSGDSRSIRSTTTNNSVLRLSTQEMSNTDPSAGLLNSPAVTKSAAPNFNGYEGLYIYNLNANIVLGSTYQPLVLSSDGRNFSLELARIPNKASIYQMIYTDYSQPLSTALSSTATYHGSTCNIYVCGSSAVAGYQGNNAPSTSTDANAKPIYSATHSSITIGSTNYDPVKNTLTAYTGADAAGISFVGPPTANLNTPVTSSNMATTNFGSAVIDGILIQHMKFTTKGL
ncbi:hypothetical protein [Acinetobacter stercoris]|nr:MULTISPECIES: hypothetical protein [Acinetobacter]